MRRQTPIAHQLYAYLYPTPGASDPPSFAAHLARNLVPEVRIEVATFYGDLNSAEARYPGLNYCHPPHRMRLGRFKHHRRLFEAFDALGLTYGEIQDFCCWEGTRWARERYERDEGVTVVDTTGDEIGPWVDRRHSQNVSGPEDGRRKSITRQTEMTVVIEETETSDASPPQPQSQRHSLNRAISYAGQSMANDSGPPTPSARDESRTSQRRRRREHTMERDILTAWEQGYGLSPEMEQWLKEQSERGLLLTSASSVMNSRREMHRSASYMSRPARSSSSSVIPRAAA